MALWYGLHPFAEHIANIQKALEWTFTSTAILLSAGRYVIRYKTVHTLDISDAFHAISLALLVALTIHYTTAYPFLSKLASPKPGEQPHEGDQKRFLDYQVASSLVWLASVYCVKFSFLFSYRALFGVSQVFMRGWWTVVAFTFLSFWASYGSVLAECGGKIQDLFDPCAYERSKAKRID